MQSRWDYKTFDKEINKFTENETEALRLFDMIDVNPKEEITFFIDSIGIPKWEENFAIVERLEMLENLPAEIQEQNRLLKDYCRLRIELYEVISKAVVYESPIYLVDINNKNKRIAELLDELNN